MPVTLVAHSTAGLAACTFAAANPSLLRGLITVGSPLQGTPLPPLRDEPTGSAVRTIEELTPDLPAGPLRDAIASLIQAMDGYLPAAARADTCPSRSRFRSTRFLPRETAIPVQFLRSPLEAR